ncbi:hypothetical protein VCHA50P416_10324 [Vibrio chagasii]|nr:hypothetical protein VCHA52P454_20236 [Vibrio chagasii]CAH7254559.1 hypothetical protein VCHA50P416_10324 [Vibrio chagasii]
MLFLSLVYCLSPKLTEQTSHKATLFSAQRKASNPLYNPNKKLKDTELKNTELKQGRYHEQIIRNIRTQRPRIAKPSCYGTHDTRSY